MDNRWLIVIVYYKKLLNKLDVEKRRMMMSRYNSNWGSHDQLQELRKNNMMMSRTIDEIRKELEQLKDELQLAHEALRREMPEQSLREVDRWRKIAGNLYDEMRLRGADCLYRHEDLTKDCMNDYELADTK